jgi:DNA-directed RNA polymerase subunit RPC12/RpoP
MERYWHECTNCGLVTGNPVNKDGVKCHKCGHKLLPIPPPVRVVENKRNEKSSTYLWLDVVKRNLIKKNMPETMINAIEEAQQVIREIVTGCKEPEGGKCQ